MAGLKVQVLAYHRITLPGDPELSPDLIDAYPADFEAQMAYVARHYNVISAHDLLRALRGTGTLPRRALVITFDDGYRCFKETAWPLLQRLGLPATLFVATHFTGTPGALFWWDELYRALALTRVAELDVPGVGPVPLGTPGQRLDAYRRLVYHLERLGAQEAEDELAHLVELCEVEPNAKRQLLGWDEVAELAESGVSVGPHTRHHPILSQVSGERLWSEVTGSWEDLKAHVPDPLPIFCYPNGKSHAISRHVVAAVKRAGFEAAVTMVGGLNSLGRTNPYLLRRTGMEAGESLRRFVFKLGPAARLYRTLKWRLSMLV